MQSWAIFRRAYYDNNKRLRQERNFRSVLSLGARVFGFLEGQRLIGSLDKVYEFKNDVDVSISGGLLPGPTRSQ